jgi:hypothetical protein
MCLTCPPILFYFIHFFFGRSGYKLLGILPNFLARRPLVPEHDFAGVIADGNSTGFKSGDSVFGWVPKGKSLMLRCYMIALV